MSLLGLAIVLLAVLAILKRVDVRLALFLAAMALGLLAGQPDAIVFRPSTGEWYVRFSSDASVHSFQFGTNGDIPFTSSITSDHVIDQNLYRPSTGVFYVRDSSTGTYTSKQLGTSTDIPVH